MANLMNTSHWLQRMQLALSNRKSRRRVATATLPGEVLEDRLLLATFSVLNPADQGAGSFRQAILDANSTSGSDRIEFNIPGSGVAAIGLESPLPALTERVTIDGWSQPGHVSFPLIVVNGSQAGPGSGLVVNAANSTIRGLVIQGFDGDGIVLSAAGTIIQGNYIGTNTAGTAALGNSGAGIRLLPGTRGTTGGNDGRNSTEKTSTTKSTTQTVEQERERNIISGNRNRIVVEGSSSTGNNLTGNYIGTDVTGQFAVPNTEFGILFEGAGANRVGGPTGDEQNVISGNGRDGIRIEGGSREQVIIGNYIGVAADGVTALGNEGNGVTIRGGIPGGHSCVGRIP
jgi:trimeric autotransporter adhesin